MTSPLSGSYLVFTNLGTFGVGPAEFDTGWWNNDESLADIRSCESDDEYIFGKDGTFHLDLQSETWLERQASTEGENICGTPVAPHDGNSISSFSYDQATNTLGIGGNGAYAWLTEGCQWF